MFLTKIARILRKYSIPYAVVGGHAVAIHGAIRGTLDVDIIIKWSKTNLEAFEKAMNEIGLVSRTPINAADLFKNKAEYLKAKNLIAWNFYNPANLSEQIDLIIEPTLGSKKTVTKNIKGESVVFISKSDLIEMKKLSGRKQDLIDIEALEKLDSLE